MKGSLIYACYNKDEELLKKGSSGSVFCLLAHYVISCGGVVFGARFDENWEVVHDMARTEEELFPLMGSKYLPSNVNGTYEKAELYLKQKKLVLYSGTPCQISGLHSYLGKKYDHLITVDVICHGVPSPVIWREYLKSRVKRKKIKSVNFRNKDSGWLDFTLKIELENGKIIQKPRNYDVFMRGFIKNAFLRPSCYQCCFKDQNEEADITLGDFWEVRKRCEPLYNEWGTSLVMLNTIKGQQIFEKVKENLHYQKISCLEAGIQNTNLKKSSLKPSYREQVFKREHSKLLHFCAKMTRPPYVKNEIKKLRKYIGKMIRKQT